MLIGPYIGECQGEHHGCFATGLEYRKLAEDFSCKNTVLDAEWSYLGVDRDSLDL
jgi:hypothetical protein